MRHFIGFQNFVTVFTEDKVFMKAIKNSVVWVAVSVAAQTILGFWLAYLLNQKFKEEACTGPWSCPLGSGRRYGGHYLVPDLRRDLLVLTPVKAGADRPEYILVLRQHQGYDSCHYCQCGEGFLLYHQLPVGTGGNIR